MDATFRKLLRCPLHPDAGPLEALGDGLRCPDCERVYPVLDGIPDMLVRADPDDFLDREVRQWDEQATGYDEARRKDPDSMAAIAAAARALAPRPGDLVLDAGCGTGLTVRQYYRPGMTVVALDLSLESLRYLKAHCPGATVYPVRGDLTMLPFAEGAFDRVVSANALNQIPDARARRQGVRELARVARPRARVVVSVQNYTVLKRRAGWRKEATAKGLSGPVHYMYRYDAAEFRDLLASELRVEKVRGAGLPLWYKWKLSWVSHAAERWVLTPLPASAHWGNVLVGTARKEKAAPPARPASSAPALPR